MEKDKEEQLASLVGAYKELKSSKMVLAEKHIANILKVIAEKDLIYNLIAEKILGFDFIGRMKGLLENDIELLDIIQSQEVIPFVFCVLNEIDNKNIETVAFIKQIFGSDSEKEFGEFCDKLVEPFISSIKNCLIGDEELSEEYEDPSNYIRNLFTADLIERVQYITGEIAERVAGLKKIPANLKQDIDIICYSIDLCVDAGEYIGVFGLLSGLKQCIYPLKKFKAEIAEIDMLLESMNK